MDTVYAPGAHAVLRGQSGIRCEPLTDGELRVGPATLTEAEPLPADELHRRVMNAV